MNIETLYFGRYIYIKGDDFSAHDLTLDGKHVEYTPGLANNLLFHSFEIIQLVDGARQVVHLCTKPAKGVWGSDETH